MRPVRLATWVTIAAAALFVLVLALAAWLLRDQIYRTYLDPGEPFQTYTPPPAPDYADAETWYLQPDFDADDNARPAVFFVHETTYPGGGNWNGELDKPLAVAAVRQISLPNFAEPFRAAGEIAAPRYRQAALYAFLNNREDSISARLFAYEDVRRAFTVFRNRIGETRPFILVGVGQGGLHALGLLIDDIAPDDGLRTRLIAAYLIESTAPLDLFEGPLATIPPCAAPDSVRCIVAYASAQPHEDERIRVITERTMSWSPQGGLDFIAGRGLACVNPILGARTNDNAPARLHRGGVAAEGFEQNAVPAPLPGQTGAQCVDGVLMTEIPRSPSLRRSGRLVEEYRTPTFNLFYEDLRLDAQRRAAALEPILHAERTIAPDLPEPEDVRTAPVRPIPDRDD